MSEAAGPPGPPPPPGGDRPGGNCNNPDIVLDWSSSENESDDDSARHRNITDEGLRKDVEKDAKATKQYRREMNGRVTQLEKTTSHLVKTANEHKGELFDMDVRLTEVENRQGNLENRQGNLENHQGITDRIVSFRGYIIWAIIAWLIVSGIRG